MSSYIPSYQVSDSFPEPEQWNGDARPMRGTGRRLTQSDVARCYNCGDDTDALPGHDGHTFCSHACCDAWVRR